ncbi:MAG: response regulator [Anaerolineales bacterium]
MRAVIAGDEPIYRRAVAFLLTSKLGIEIVGETRDQGELLALVENNQPELIILDDGSLTSILDQIIPALHNQEFKPAVIVISERRGTEELASAAGADRFVSKGDHPNELLIAVKSALTTADDEHHTDR